MKTKDFTISLQVNKPAIDVFNSINNVRGWWSEEVEGDTESLNSEFEYHYEDVHSCKIKIVESVPSVKVVWKVLDNYFSFTQDKSEWKGTSLIFDIRENNGQSALVFTHQGLIPEYECYDICSNAWTTYIRKSLFDLIMTGKGHPNGKDKPQTEDEIEFSSGDFSTVFFTDKTADEVFAAINKVSGWWQGEIKGHTGKAGDEFEYRMKDIHYSKQRITEMIPGRKIEWTVTDSRLKFISDPSEWTGTKIIFSITEINNKTQLRFTHKGLKENVECYNSCSNAWTNLIQKSLFNLVTTGIGVKVFGE